MHSKPILALLLVLLLLSACAQAAPGPVDVVVAATPAVVPLATQAEIPTLQPITETDARGKAFEFAQAVSRVISLAPANTEILFAVGAGAQVFGRDSYSDFPAEVKSIADVGDTLGTMNTEAILAAKPDLILAGDLTPAEHILTLEDLGLRVFVLGNPKNLAEMYDNLLLIARVTGHVQQTEALVNSLKEREKVIDQKLAGVTERALVLYELDGTDPNAPWVPGPGTFVDTLITQAGGTNLGASLQGAWVQVSLETLIEKQPDLILLGDATWGGMTVQMVADRGGWDALTAVKNGKVFPFDDNLVSRPGPRMVEGLEALAKFLHPELFQ